MIRHDNSLIQPTLFQRTLKEFLKETGVGINDLKKWAGLKWLSFKLNSKATFDDKEMHEVVFIKSLVRCGLPRDTIKFMLSQLERPYCYRHSDICWDFSKDEWREINELVRQRLGDESEEIVADYLDSYLEKLCENDEKEELKRIVARIKKLLKQAD